MRVPASGRAVVKLFLAILLLAGLSSPSKGAAGDAPPAETEVKAAFVLNFIRLVNWAKLPSAAVMSDLTVCALGNSEFTEAVRQHVAGKMAGSRRVTFTVEANPSPSRCRVLIIDGIQYQVARPALNAVRDAPVLTIGNGPGLLPLGGMFELVVEDRRVQFDASREAVRRANLDVSERLMQLSRNLRRIANGTF